MKNKSKQLVLAISTALLVAPLLGCGKQETPVQTAPIVKSFAYSTDMATREVDFLETCEPTAIAIEEEPTQIFGTRPAAKEADEKSESNEENLSSYKSQMQEVHTRWKQILGFGVMFYMFSSGSLSEYETRALPAVYTVPDLEMIRNATVAIEPPDYMVEEHIRYLEAMDFIIDMLYACIDEANFDTSLYDKGFEEARKQIDDFADILELEPYPLSEDSLIDDFSAFIKTMEKDEELFARMKRNAKLLANSNQCLLKPGLKNLLIIE